MQSILWDLNVGAIKENILKLQSSNIGSLSLETWSTQQEVHMLITE